MLHAFFTAVEHWPLSTALRGSTWAYPLVNTAHIIGIALLFGAIAPLDLRLAGLWPRQPLAPLRRVLVPVAVFGMVLTVCAGVLLFMAKAGDYSAAPIFQIKMVVVTLALINAAALTLSPGWRALDRNGNAGSGAIGTGIRIAAIISLVLWLTAILLGRLVGYF